MAKDKFKIQDDQYKFPYHHLVAFYPFSNYKVMSWGFEYYAYIAKVIDIVKGKQFTTLLDVGCGEGKMLLELEKVLPGKKIKGVDLSERAIIFAKAFNYGNGVEFGCEDIALIKDTYDIVTLVETAEHIPEEEIPGFIRNIHNRLNKEGIVVVTVPSVNFPLQAKHYRHYDLPLLVKQFQGFSLEETHYLVKQGISYLILVRLSSKFCSFLFMRKLLFMYGKIFLFDATAHNARHIVCVFKKV